MRGDKAQLPPTVISNRENKASRLETLSLFERLTLSHLEAECQYINGAEWYTDGRWAPER